MKLIKKNPLFYAFLLPAIVDGVLTLIGQSPDYWSHKVVNEASPVYYFLLTSPLLYIFGAIVWFVFWYWIFRKLKEPINLFLMFLFVAGHSWGGTTWIWNITKRNNFYTSSNQTSVIIVWFMVICYFALVAFFATYCLRFYLNNKKLPSKLPKNNKSN